MTLVIGRGKNRRVFNLPCGELISQEAKNDPVAYQAGLNTVCSLLGIQ